MVRADRASGTDSGISAGNCRETNAVWEEVD